MKLTLEGYAFLFKSVFYIAAAITLYMGISWVFRAEWDWRRVTVDGVTVTKGDCRKDMRTLRSFEGWSPDRHPRVPDLVVTTLPEGRMSSCGARAFTALQHYFSLKDDLDNLRTTMSGSMTSFQIAMATRNEQEKLREAEQVYLAEATKIRLAVEQ
ncbi:hypothetical protein [Azoarcus sp. KH32C]|uniref:hypothetical protein n=1 Tax=Azoarcus sp. KH32C TaxID=748247 RepID=UPI0012EA2924|nr:hypothetical protein [Azoarcus sp. KH32C]